MNRLLPHPRLLACLLLLGLGVPTSGHAQETPEEDGGVTVPAPDASVGEGGADRDNPEGEDGVGRVVTDCHSTADCSPRFACTQGKCKYSGIREAERVGCLLGPEAAVMLVGLGLVVVTWRRRQG
ncbi:MXAN_6627.5 family MYXO-CTERM protein [Hyalangium rubrum]|uniref:MXAN_6627.5 family MYXO-CTERM protein n=1 Tax=Hyalangium rubrum TaxID=3103134 RepID=A0ABU5H2L3_9BACT|nr:MXAN_6627.5 family MYXO-CTERM protein [Hyalangium sp. s54d21]MDY7227625.1 MXAN_6627.5 family MYXO-CTERM protein [Hyalangium sp. s54d21]